MYHVGFFMTIDCHFLNCCFHSRLANLISINHHHDYSIISYELQIKTDVETQGDFIRFLIKEVEGAAFSDIEDVVPFVKWLDDELSFLVTYFLLFE